jgi:hypothetical protein
MSDAGVREPSGVVETAAYVAALTRELARLAREHRLNMLGYLLDMAQLEAQSIAGVTAAPEPQSE